MSKYWKYIFLYILVFLITVFFAFSVKQAIITSIICSGIIIISAYLYKIYPQFRKNNTYIKIVIFLVIAFIFSYSIWHGIEFSLLCCLIDFAYILDSKRAIDVDIKKETMWGFRVEIEDASYKSISLEKLEKKLRDYCEKKGVKILIKKAKILNVDSLINDEAIYSKDSECLIIHSPLIFGSSINYYLTAYVDKAIQTIGKYEIEIKYLKGEDYCFSGFLTGIGKVLVEWIASVGNYDAKMILDDIEEKNKKRYIIVGGEEALVTCLRYGIDNFRS